MLNSTNSSVISTPQVWCVPQRLEEYRSNRLTSVYLLDNRKSILFDNKFAFSSMPLLESNILQCFSAIEDYIDTVHYIDRCFKRQVLFLQIAEMRPQPMVVIHSTKASFNYYYEEWNKEIKYQSSTDAITNNAFFKKIIALGSEVIPYIIEALRDMPSFLIIALYKITGVNPIKSDHRGKIKEMTRDWIEWWEKNILQ
jgi:hypothetical protein